MASPRALVAMLLLALGCAAVCAQADPVPAVDAAASAPATVPEEGRTLERAVVIATSGNGVGAEYAWLAQHYPVYRRVSQTLLQHKDRVHWYDLIEISTAEGKTVFIYFDITATHPQR